MRLFSAFMAGVALVCCVEAILSGNAVLAALNGFLFATNSAFAIN